MPAGGGSVSSLQAFTQNTAAGSGTVVVNLIDNSTGVTKLSCTINASSPSGCANTGSASVAAGDYLQVQVVVSADASVDKGHYRVTFRY